MPPVGLQELNTILQVQQANRVSLEAKRDPSTYLTRAYPPSSPKDPNRFVELRLYSPFVRLLKVAADHGLYHAVVPSPLDGEGYCMMEEMIFIGWSEEKVMEEGRKRRRQIAGMGMTTHCLVGDERERKEVGELGGEEMEPYVINIENEKKRREEARKVGEWGATESEVEDELSDEDGVD